VFSQIAERDRQQLEPDQPIHSQRCRPGEQIEKHQKGNPHYFRAFRFFAGRFALGGLPAVMAARANDSKSMGRPDALGEGLGFAIAPILA
jgi:hypothetical protein